MRFERTVGGAVLVALLALAGCNSGPTMGDVRGTVLVDGKPAEGGGITFEPADGNGQTAGGEIHNGQYATQVPVGAAKVRISVAKVVGRKKVYDTPDSPIMPITVEALPARYNEQTELELEVKPGLNQKDWDLKSK